jgi:aryl-alcohol dehydrogenase-like predicted oxidoreductase
MLVDKGGMLAMTDRVSRRSFLLHGAAAASSIALTPAALAANKVLVRYPNSPAGAAGRFWIGGDLQINRIGLGTTEFTSTKGVVAADPASLRALLRRAVELGVNHIDCADVYGSGIVDGLCERFIYDALYPYPADLIVATKGGQIRGAPGPQWQIVDGSPRHLRSACEASLKRLRLEQIPLYYMHQPDPKVPYADSIGELGKLQKEGKIRHIGVSNVTADEFAQARSLVKVAAIQNRYNILARQADDILATCEREHIVFVPYSPLGGRTAAALNGEDARLAGLKALAEEKHVSLAQIVLAWLLARSPVIVAIPGTTKIEHLEDDIAAGKVRLTKKEVERIEKLG